MEKQCIVPFCLLVAIGLSACFSFGRTDKKKIIRASEASPSVSDSIIGAYFSAIRSQHQEKLWLHLNQSRYEAGDTIWFQAYLVNAETHFPDTLSNFIYVDLYDRGKRLMNARKVKRDSMGFANCLPIPDTLSAGEYTLRAYTGWMLNFDAACFFQKNITIGQKISNVDHSITYTDDKMIVRFFDKNERPLSGREVWLELRDKDGKYLSERRQTSSSTGAVFIPLDKDSSKRGAYADIRISIREDSVYRRTVFIEPPTSAFDIQFLPEGGDLVPGALQMVAFRAVDPNGNPAEVQGYLLDGRNDTVTFFRSEHDGMGGFLFTPRTGEHYRTVSFHDTLSVSSSLPVVRDDACALQVVRRNRDIRYWILGKVPEKAMLVGHMRGTCCFLQSVDGKRNAGIIKTDSLREGILHLLVIDSCGHPRTERQVYIHRSGQIAHFAVRADKPRYGAREKVKVDISLCREDEPLSGRFSVGITDAHVVRADSLADNIHTNLLLTSDLKGHVHDPGYYFLDDSPVRQRYLDLVMLTHGWRRFSTDDLSRPVPFVPKYFFEHGQHFSGRVTNLLGMGLDKASVTALTLQGESVVGHATTDSTGRFLVDGIDFQDTTVFFVSAQNKHGRIAADVVFDKPYPRPNLIRKCPFGNNASPGKPQTDVYGQPMRRVADSTGLKGYSLDEFVVRGKNPDAPAVASNRKTYNDTAQFAKFNTQPLLTYLKSLPEVVLTVDEYGRAGICLKGVYGSCPAQILVNDEILHTTDYLNLFSVGDVEYIRMVTPRMLVDLPIESLYFKGYPCRIEIRMKDEAQGEHRFGLYKTVGYIERAEFYHPVYDTPEKSADKKPDRRTTLYWEPCLQLGDDGTTTVEFYSNDSEKSSLEIVIEGIASDGSVCRIQQDL